VSRITLGTWAIGGWLWGGTNEAESIATIRAALAHGINVVDTAPVYGFGRSEEIVGKALADGLRQHVVVATKVGLEWQDGKITRNASRERIMREIDDSLRRLRTDSIDIYQQMGEFRRTAPLHVLQPPYNLFERAAEAEVLPYCRAHGIATLGYGALCRGLLSGRMRADTKFTGDDLRQRDPKFQTPRFAQYIAAVERLDRFAQERYGKRVIDLAVRFVLDQGVTTALWGARRPDQLDPVEAVMGWSLDAEAKSEIERILAETITDPVGPEFMAPPEWA
jgi:aryl-alcohol dehydrogenase-like predicted oxidoreductase